MGRRGHDVDECLICHAELEYLEHEEAMECAICHRTFPSNTRCVHGHFVCDDCHRRGLDAIVGVCRAETTSDPIAIMEDLMGQPFCHMNGPEHHTMVGAALLTAYHNAGGELDLGEALKEMLSRGKQVPGGICGMWGCCGAAVSCGIFMSIVTGTNPFSERTFGLCNHMTSEALAAVAKVGGPRCCKRESYLCLLVAACIVREELGVTLTPSRPVCTRAAQNRLCTGLDCPFSPLHAQKEAGATLQG